MKTTYPVKQKLSCSTCGEEAVFSNEVSQYQPKMDEIAYLEDQMMAEIDEWNRENTKRRRMKRT
jgi:hypothetical protein